MYRGSRKHILDWAESPTFLPELLATVSPVEARITAKSMWMPRSYREPDEARLESFGPRFLSNHSAWSMLESWWLRNPRGANTPNWDIAVGCEIERTPGLILVEAKANVRELSDAGKAPRELESVKSQENTDQIGRAIDEARRGLSSVAQDINISRDRCYQLSNRLAFLWKLTSLGVPTVLLYLGFCGDAGIADAGEPLENADHWKSVFHEHAAALGADSLIGRRLEINSAPGWLLVEARNVIGCSSQPVD
jgi:hypothetical protein